MRRSSVFTVVFSCLFFPALLSAQGVPAKKVVFDGGFGPPGFSVVNQSQQGLELDYSVPSVTFGTMTVGGETFTTVGIPGVILPNDPGAPNLPGVSRFIAFPRGASYSIRITGSRTRVFKDVNVIPAAPIQRENDDSPPSYKKDPAIYGADADYPSRPVLASPGVKMRGVDVFLLGVTPFAYNPVRKTLTVYTDLRIEVTFAGGGGQFGDPAFRSRWLEPMLRENILNYATLPAVDFDARPAARGEECEYMIFSPDDPDYLSWAGVIGDFRIKQGITTKVFNIADLGGTANGIENKINDAYHNWTVKPVAALMLGDLPMMPVKTWNSYCLSDNIYADVDGDNLPELNVARITARNASDLTLLVNKFIDYETNPPANPSFYDEPVIAGGWQSDRWFILCADVCRGFLYHALGKNAVREYAGYSGGSPSYWSTNQNTQMIIDYFGTKGLHYIEDTPYELTDWGGNATRINSDINSGAFMLIHRDHGSETGWGSPSYSISNLSGLTNTDLTFVWSINCLTGRYDYSPQCFAEAFHRMQYGALGLIAASNISYSFVNDTFVWGMMDSMWPAFDPGYGGSTGPNELMPGFANMSGKWYLQASSWPYNPGNKDETDHLFHMHGDAFTQVYSEVPQTLTVSHDSSINNTATSFEVTADAGSLIALSAHDEVLGTGVGTGSPVTIYIDPPTLPGIMYVTVTKPNFYRYEGQVVIQTGGPLAVWLPDGYPDSVLPGPPLDVTVAIVDGVEHYVPGSGLVHYRFDPADPFDSAQLASLGGDLYNAHIPGARPDSRPEFYISAMGDGGSTVYSPSGAPNTTYSYTLDGLPIVLFHDDFETDTGWTVTNQNLQTGAWERCVPNPTSGQQVAPLEDNPAGTGTYCYVTENGPPGGTYSDYDIDGGPTILTSPTFDLSTGDATVGGYAWYYSRDSNDPFKIDVSNDGGATWTNVFTTMNSLSGWTPFSFDVADYVAPTAHVKVRISAQDQPNNDIVEAGLDDFEVSRIDYDASIWAGAYSFSAPSGCDIPVYLDAGSAYAGRAYIVGGSLSGSIPGTPLPGGKILPLNWDWLTTFILNHPASPVFADFRGSLDGRGEAVAAFRLAGPGASAYIGRTLTFAFTLTGSFDFVSNPVSIAIEP